MISTTERKLRTYKNKISRIISIPVFDTGTSSWQRKYNKELQLLLKIGSIINFIKGQKIQWLGYIIRQKENDLLRAAFEWISQGRRSCGRPRKK